MGNGAEGIWNGFYHFGNGARAFNKRKNRDVFTKVGKLVLFFANQYFKIEVKMNTLLKDDNSDIQ